MGYKIYAPKPMSDESMEMLRKKGFEIIGEWQDSREDILFGKGGDGAFRQAGGVSALGLFIYCFHFRLLLSGQIPAPYDRAARRPRGRWSACRG